MEVLREAPKASSFVPLVEHQSSTPASFYSGPPVLHYYSDRSKLIVIEHEAQSIPALALLLDHAQTRTDGSEPSTNGDSNGTRQQKVIEELDVFVTSDKLFLFSNTANTGLSIPYPSISLHAIQSLPQPSVGEQQGLYMQVIQPSADSNADDEPDSISLTVIPTESAPTQVATASGTTEDGFEGEDKPEQTPVQAMFNALSSCSNLHPDPDNDEDEEDGEGGQSRLFRAGLAFPGATDGGMPPAMPGSGGWITAENMHEFFDASGNWIGGDDEDDAEDEMIAGNGAGLGPGAGTVRTREDGEPADDPVDGEETDETKWRRTD